MREERNAPKEKIETIGKKQAELNEEELEMKKKNKFKVRSTLYYIASILFFLSAIICFVDGNDTAMGVVWLGLGSTFLCLGAVSSKENKDDDDKDK